MLRWHSVKLSKYESLVKVIVSKGWVADLFAVEVGARGYCSVSLTDCLRKLGFPNKSAFATGKSLSRLSMEASFCIWLAWESTSWETDPHDVTITYSQKSKENPLPCPPVKQLPRVRRTPSVAHVRAGFANKGNSCYAGAILQALSVTGSLGFHLASQTLSLSPLAKSIVGNLSMINKAKCSSRSK